MICPYVIATLIIHPYASNYFIILVTLVVNLENEVVDEETVVLTILMDPGQYRNIEEIIKQETQVNQIRKKLN